MNWTDEYREIVEFYYWEPQHIGRSGGVRRFKGADEMYEHVHKLEVSLNHVLNIFFSLYPLDKLQCFDAANDHKMLSSWQLEQLQRDLKNATQPDIFFVGTHKNIAVELKTKSKCDFAQIVKYIQFNKSLPNPRINQLEIILLTPYTDIENVFKEKYKALDEVYSSISQAGLEMPEIKLVSYGQLLLALKESKLNNDTEKKLVNGLIAYLEKRQDLNINY